MEARPYRLDYDGHWRIDLGELAVVIDDRTRAILVVSPNNPTGSFLHRDDLVALAELCLSKQIALIGDEVFTDFAFDGDLRHPSVLEAEGVVSCSLGGLSKSAGLPLVKLGWIAFGGPDARVREVIEAFEVVADTYLSVSTPIQVALPTLIERGGEVREQIKARIRRNLGALRQAVSRFRRSRPTSRAAGQRSCKCRRTQRGIARARALTDDHVLVHPVSSSTSTAKPSSSSAC